MLLTQLHDEPLIHVLHFLHGKDICKLEVTCRKFRQLSYIYDNVAWKSKCKTIWENKIRALVRMNEDIVLPIGFFDIRNPAVLDDLFEKTHVPLHEKVLAFQEVFNMKDSNNLMNKIKKFPKRRRLDVSENDKVKLDPSWKTLYTLDYLTDKFQGKYRKKKGPKLYLSPMLLYSPFTVPKSAIPMPKTRVPSFQTNRFWGVGNADEIYYIIKERPESSKRPRTNSLTTSGENTLRNFFNRGRSNSVSGETKTNTNTNEISPEKLRNSTNSLPFSQTTNTQSTNTQSTTHPPQTTKTINVTTTSYISTTHHPNHTTTTHHHNTSTTTTTTTTHPRSISSSISTTFPPSTNLHSSSSSKHSLSSSTSTSSSSKHSLSSSTSQIEPPTESKNAFEHPMLLPLGQLYFEQRPNGSIDTVGGIWTVVQTRKGRMLVLWRVWRLVCYAEPLMPTKLAYEWLPPAPLIQPTSYLDLHYDTMGPWHSGKVVAEKLWKMRPWYDQVE